jgi:hypothetical protein
MDNASWAVHYYADRLGCQVDGSLLFGVGGSACYEIEGHGERPMLRMLSADRVQRMFYALNISLEHYDYLCDTPVGPSDFDRIQSNPVLFEVSRDSEKGVAGQRDSQEEYVWVRRRQPDVAVGDWPLLEVARQNSAPHLVQGDHFAETMLRRNPKWIRFLYFVPLAQSVHWDRKRAAQHFVRRHYRQMSNKNAGCLEELRQFARLMQDVRGTSETLLASVSNRHDALTSRRELAQAFVTAASILGQDYLLSAADQNKAIASIWESLPHGSTQHSNAILHEVISLEEQVVALLGQRLKDRNLD